LGSDFTHTIIYIMNAAAFELDPKLLANEFDAIGFEEEEKPEGLQNFTQWRSPDKKYTFLYNLETKILVITKLETKEVWYSGHISSVMYLRQVLFNVGITGSINGGKYY